MTVPLAAAYLSLDKGQATNLTLVTAIDMKSSLQQSGVGMAITWMMHRMRQLNY